jgi:peroxiredoxin
MTITTIADQVDQLQAQVTGQLPAAVLAVLESSQADLKAAGVPADVAEPGDQLPDAVLLNALGERTSLYAVTGNQRAVIVFYRGVWCPYCNIALKAYQDQLLPRLHEKRINLVAVSPQNPDGSLSMREKNDLTFPVVSDPGNALASHVGVLMPQRSPELRVAQEQLGLDLAAANADNTENLPMATVIIADAEHIIRWIDVQPDYTVRTEPADILAALDTL